MTTEFLLKEACYLLYRLVHVRDEMELSRDEYLMYLGIKFEEEKRSAQLVTSMNKSRDEELSKQKKKGR